MSQFLLGEILQKHKTLYIASFICLFDYPSPFLRLTQPGLGLLPKWQIKVIYPFSHLTVSNSSQEVVALGDKKERFIFQVLFIPSAAEKTFPRPY